MAKPPLNKKTQLLKTPVCQTSSKTPWTKTTQTLKPQVAMNLKKKKMMTFQRVKMKKMWVMGPVQKPVHRQIFQISIHIPIWKNSSKISSSWIPIPNRLLKDKVLYKISSNSKINNLVLALLEPTLWIQMLRTLRLHLCQILKTRRRLKTKVAMVAKIRPKMMGLLEDMAFMEWAISITQPTPKI